MVRGSRKVLTITDRRQSESQDPIWALALRAGRAFDSEVKLTSEAARLSREVPDWERDGNRTLKREFSFANFRDSFGFVARVALLAEAEQHHPDIELGWGRAAFELTTHAASGLTRNDFVMAARIDGLAQ